MITSGSLRWKVVALTITAGRGFEPVSPVNGTFTTITWPRL
jgi:hypothetical protein